ncbi:MAG: hypothetical protein WKG07_05005 [Hymenobacter sp.]
MAKQLPQPARRFHDASSPTNDGQDLAVTLTRAEFDDLIRPLVQRTIRCRRP